MAKLSDKENKELGFLKSLKEPTDVQLERIIALEEKQKEAEPAKGKTEEKKSGPENLPKKNGKDIYHEEKVISTGSSKGGHPAGKEFFVHPSLAAVLEKQGKVERTGEVKKREMKP